VSSYLIKRAVADADTSKMTACCSSSRVGLIAAAIVATSALTACGSAADLEFRMYDTTHQAPVEIHTADLIRNSVRVARIPGNPPAIYFKLTRQGESNFRSLTRVLAKRGARLHAIQHMAIEVNGKVYARAGVDWKLYPQGLNPDTGFEVGLRDLATARGLANELRGG
jgi:hypothetical protein